MSKKFKKALAFIATAAMAFSATSVLPYSTSGSIVASAADETLTPISKERDFGDGKGTHKATFEFGDMRKGHKITNCLKDGESSTTGTYDEKCEDHVTEEGKLVPHEWDLAEGVTVPKCKWCDIEDTRKASVQLADALLDIDDAEAELENLKTVLQAQQNKLTEEKTKLANLETLTGIDETIDEIDKLIDSKKASRTAFEDSVI